MIVRTRRPVPRSHLIDRTRVWRAAAAALGLAAMLSVFEALAAAPDERVTVTATGVFPLLGAVAALRFGPGLAPRTSYRVGRAFLFTGVLVNAVSVNNWTGTAVGGAMMYHYVTAAVFAALFFARRDVVQVCALVGAAQGVAVFSAGHGAAEALVWVMTMLAVGGTGAVLHVVAHRMEETTYRDALTGAENRRAWDAAVAQLEEEQARDRMPSSVILLDLDRFKAVNDAGGHEAGDALLRGAVEAWQRVTRASDTLARLGGDEFGLVLVGCDHAPALDRARSMLVALREATGETCSIGVATMHPGDDPTELVATADRALYAAKAAGRACVRGAVVEQGTAAVHVLAA